MPGRYKHKHHLNCMRAWIYRNLYENMAPAAHGLRKTAVRILLCKAKKAVSAYLFIRHLLQVIFIHYKTRIATAIRGL